MERDVKEVKETTTPTNDGQQYENSFVAVEFNDKGGVGERQKTNNFLCIFCFCT